MNVQWPWTEREPTHFTFFPTKFYLRVCIYTEKERYIYVVPIRQEEAKSIQKAQCPKTRKTFTKQNRDNEINRFSKQNSEAIKRGF